MKTKKLNLEGLGTFLVILIIVILITIALHKCS
jgi:hypothetical protein